MKIIAHRSGPSVYPEQTIVSAKLAMQNGADLIEVDVRYTKDKKLAVTHDAELDRVFGVHERVGEITAEEFLALRHKDNRAYPAHLFEDYLACGVGPILIHVKEDETIGDLIDLAEKYGQLENVVLGLHSSDTVRAVREMRKDVKILAFMPSQNDIRDFADAGVNYIRLWEGWLSEKNIKLVRETGCDLWVMIGGGDGFDAGETTQENLDRVISLAVDGILINDITMIR